jgi:hypothetical protein
MEISQVELTQQQLLGKDVDINQFHTQMDGKLAVKLSESIVSAQVSRTIDGASTLVVGVEDPKLTLLRSGRLSARNLDVQIDGLWWRYQRLEKQGRTLNLTFEEREVAILRRYKNVKGPVARTQMTRAEFIVGMLKEVREIFIPYYIPELHKRQPIFNQKDQYVYPGVDPQRVPGVAASERLTVKGSPATMKQREHATAILNTGDSMIDKSNPHKKKIMVCSMMTVITESRIGEDVGTDDTAVGDFQQNPKWWPATGDPSTDSAAWFVKAVDWDLRDPNLSYNDLCQKVQNSGKPNAYGRWRTEGERWVAAWGLATGNPVDPGPVEKNANMQHVYEATEGGDYHYWRGIMPTDKNTKWLPEDTWTCIQRLADKVNWRAFFISGTFYYMDERDLFNSAPRAVWSEESDGIDDISGDYDTNKPAATLQVSLRMGRYAVPPGCVVRLEGMGPWDGRWLVETVERDMFSPHGTITLKKPSPQFPEPYQDELASAKGAYGAPSLAQQQGLTESDAKLVKGPIKELANRIMQYEKQGRLIGGPSPLSQLRKAAEGIPWKGPCGDTVVPQTKLLQIMLWILDSGWIIYLNALCEDHDCLVKGTTRRSEHAEGGAMDIGRLGKPGAGVANLGVSSPTGKQWAIELMDALHSVNPSQIICNGVGYDDDEVRKHQWNHGAPTTSITDDHTDHIHVGA